MTDLIFLLIILTLVAIVFAVIRIVPDNSRYAVFQDGSFVKLKGPGLLLKLPGQSQNWVRLTVGDRAEIVDLRLAAINGVNIPIETAEGAPSGAGMRVSGFRDNKVLVGTGKA